MAKGRSVEANGLADISVIDAARRLLADETPLESDCGALCGHRCCMDFDPEHETGVYLIPGELGLYDGSEDWLKWKFHATAVYEFAPSWEHHSQIPFMICQKLCQREKRPLDCRTYPLVPFLCEDGSLEMRYAPWAKGVCPLADGYELEQLRPAFRLAARQAWELLIQDPEMLDHVRWQTEQIKEWEKNPVLWHERPVEE